jgi:hypothetical protein
MIGLLINEFDDLDEPTLEDFNNTFRVTLKGDLSSPVKIGSMVVGGLRKVVIGGKTELIRLPTITDRRTYKVYRVMKDGEVIYTTDLLKNVSILLQTERRKVSQYCEQGRVLFGHRIDKIPASKIGFSRAKNSIMPVNYFVDMSSNCGLMKTGRPSDYQYKYTSGDKVTFFDGMKSFTKETGISRKTAEARLKKGIGHLKGWRIEQFEKTTTNKGSL